MKSNQSVYNKLSVILGIILVVLMILFAVAIDVLTMFQMIVLAIVFVLCGLGMMISIMGGTK